MSETVSKRTPASRLVAHILPYPTIGGTEQATLRIMKAVEPHGVDGIAVCLFESEDLRQFFGAAKRRILEWPAPEPSIRRGRNFYAQSCALADEFKRLGVTLVHCADHPAAHFAALAGRLAGVPVLCHVRNRHDSISRRDQLFLLPVTHFAFVSQDTWNHYGSSVAPRRGSVVYDGIDPPPERTLAAMDEGKAAVWAEFGLAPETKLIGMLARVAPQKDFATLIQAAASVVQAHPEVRFMVAGDCSASEVSRDHYAHVRQLLQQAGLTDFFIFTGYRSDALRLLGAFDILVLSTHYEGLPLALVEAMAYAKPVVATAVDGIPELIKDGVDGFLTPHADAEDLAAKLLALLDQPAFAARLGTAARRTVLQNFTAEHFAGRMMDLYTRLLK
jgi:glycosyltransferase involved in cell wall biosynthesis